MKIVFISNYFNHHQAPFLKALDELTEHNFYFIETKPIREERRKMGWGNEAKPDYVLQSYLSRDQHQLCDRLMLEADTVIWGNCPYGLLLPRLRAHKLTFMYSERLFKDTRLIKNLCRIAKYLCKVGPFQKNHYLLCAGSYAQKNFNSIMLFRSRTYKWGYFPAAKKYDDPDIIIHAKKPASILWVARLIELKHPEYALYVAKRLKENGYSFTMNIIGNGILEDDLAAQIKQFGLTDYVHLLGAMSPEDVRKNMELSEIFLFTSDRREGWGAVVNESMNSCCAVVASSTVGSAHYLIRDAENGFIYPDGDCEALYEKTVWLLEHNKERKQISRNAYHTIADCWNAEVASSRLIRLIFHLQGECGEDLYSDGPCSKA